MSNTCSPLAVCYESNFMYISVLRMSEYKGAEKLEVAVGLLMNVKFDTSLLWRVVW